MKNLLSLLERFSHALNKDTHLKESISEIVKEKTGASISPENITLNRGVLELSIGAALKNEITLKEAWIKEELNSRGVFFSRILFK
jgi:hypothetical protein